MQLATQTASDATIVARCEAVMAANPEWDYSQTVHYVAATLQVPHMLVQDVWAAASPDTEE